MVKLTSMITITMRRSEDEKRIGEQIK